MKMDDHQWKEMVSPASAALLAETEGLIAVCKDFLLSAYRESSVCEILPALLKGGRSYRLTGNGVVRMPHLKDHQCEQPARTYGNQEIRGKFHNLHRP
jgi:hypothetical protein